MKPKVDTLAKLSFGTLDDQFLDFKLSSFIDPRPVELGESYTACPVRLFPCSHVNFGVQITPISKSTTFLKKFKP